MTDRPATAVDEIARQLAKILVRLDALEHQFATPDAPGLTPTSERISVAAAVELMAAAGKLVNPPPEPSRTPPDLTDPYADDDADDDWAEPDDWSDIPGDTAIVMVSPDQGDLFPDPNLAGPDDAVFDDD